MYEEKRKKRRRHDAARRGRRAGAGRWFRSEDDADAIRRRYVSCWSRTTFRTRSCCRTTLAHAAERFEVTHVESMAEAVRRLQNGDFDAVLLDLSLPDSRGLATVEQATTLGPRLPIIVLTGLNDEAVATEAVRKGAQDFLLKDQRLDGPTLVRTIRYAIERKRLETDLMTLNDTLERRVAERTEEARRLSMRLRALAAELGQVEQRERRRLAQILHDHVQQLIVAAQMRLGILEKQRLSDGRAGHAQGHQRYAARGRRGHALAHGRTQPAGPSRCRARRGARVAGAPDAGEEPVHRRTRHRQRRGAGQRRCPALPVRSGAGTAVQRRQAFQGGPGPGAA